MTRISTETIQIIIELLAAFLNDEGTSTFEQYKANPQVFHYYIEIIRYWSKINFILRKTLRSLNLMKIFDKPPPESASFQDLLQGIYFYATYRMIWEQASPNTILNELENYKERLNKEFQFAQFLYKLQTFDWEIAVAGKTHIERLSLEEAMPTFVLRHLVPVMPFEFLQQNLQFMNNMSTLTDCTIRINPIIDDESESELIQRIQSDFMREGVSFRQDPEVHHLFYVPFNKRTIILKNRWYQSGYLIFQDKASAIIAQILDPQPGEVIWDMCAAPGLKTSLIGQSSTSLIMATDIHLGRTYEMHNLLGQLRIKDLIHIINADGINAPIRSGCLFDKILLDAPCTGSGTFFTNPSLKWRQDIKFLWQNRFFQMKLFEAALQRLKPHGVLVYSTCSLYEEEGEMQILKFLDKLVPRNLPDWFSPSYKMGAEPLAGTGRLFPAIHHTQGFFIAKFEKKRIQNEIKQDL